VPACLRLFPLAIARTCFSTAVLTAAVMRVHPRPPRLVTSQRNQPDTIVTTGADGVVRAIATYDIDGGQQLV
jgi:hypothetical protein